MEQNDWSRFFESFTLQHAGWLVNVDGEKESMPLDRILARDDGRIVVHLGDDSSHHRIITIDGAAVAVSDSEGVTRGVEIASAEGRPTRLVFRAPRAS